VIEGLASKVTTWTREKERKLLDSTIRLVGDLMAAWVAHVVDSASSHRAAPKHTIVADGVYVGWRRWGTPEGSKRRLRERFESFAPIVRAGREKQLREVAK
jgi:hypothetical protein